MVCLHRVKLEFPTYCVFQTTVYSIVITRDEPLSPSSCTPVMASVPCIHHSMSNPDQSNLVSWSGFVHHKDPRSVKTSHKQVTFTKMRLKAIPCCLTVIVYRAKLNPKWLNIITLSIDWTHNQLLFTIQSVISINNASNCTSKVVFEYNFTGSIVSGINLKCAIRLKRLHCSGVCGIYATQNAVSQFKDVFLFIYVL